MEKALQTRLHVTGIRINSDAFIRRQMFLFRVTVTLTITQMMLLAQTAHSD